MPRVGPRPQTELGRKLRDLRTGQRYTIRELANEAGVSHGYVGQLEIGVDRRTGKLIEPNPRVLRRIAEVLGEPSYGELMRAAGYLPEDAPIAIPSGTGDIERELAALARRLTPHQRRLWLRLGEALVEDRTVETLTDRFSG